jgi:hypothetical protein
MNMSKDFSPADRIRISEDYHWASGELGTVMQPPGYVVNFADGWDGVYRKVSSLKGTLIFYWIKFDLPQMDSDGDGPYAEAEIDSNYLVPVETR